MDTLRLAIVEADDHPLASDGFEVQVFVNEVNCTEAGAGLGMDPDEILTPTNRFIATDTPTTIEVAKCVCGHYGCGMTDVTIVREGDVVHWDWVKDIPMDRRATFDASAYDAEVKRIANDFSWESDDRKAARLLWTSLDHDALAKQGLALQRAGANTSEVAFAIVFTKIASPSIRVRLKFCWDWLTPEQLVDEIAEFVLTKEPSTWPDDWHFDDGSAAGETCSGRWYRRRWYSRFRPGNVAFRARVLLNRRKIKPSIQAVEDHEVS